jgi:RNA methyltransferase, TrmH family
MERISSRQNAAVRRFREIARARGSAYVLLDGEHLLDEALRSGMPIEVAAFSSALAAGRLSGLADAVERSGARLLAVSDQVLAAMSPVQHPSGVVAIAARPASGMDEALARPPQLALLLRDVQDPGNVGAIVRVAEACGATGIITSEGTADPFGWKALRGSMGSALRVPIATRVSLEDAARRARLAGLRVIATVPRGGTLLPGLDLSIPVAIVLGGEGAGLPAALLDAADETLTIPMREPVESLNVATAAALITYEAMRQRTHGAARAHRRPARAARGHA